jgi:hypothetical protein
VVLSAPLPATGQHVPVRVGGDAQPDRRAGDRGQHVHSIDAPCLPGGVRGGGMGAHRDPAGGVGGDAQPPPAARDGELLVGIRESTRPQAVRRVQGDSELRDFWEEAGDSAPWLADVDDLLKRLRRSSAGEPPAISP